MTAQLSVRTAFLAIVLCMAAGLTVPPGVFAAPLPLAATSLDDRAHWSSRTISVGLLVDRDEASVLAFAAKSRPFKRDLEPTPARGDADERLVQLEVVLLGPAGERFVHRVDAGPICLAHGPDAEPHVAGDTILLHRDAFVVELPWWPGFDRVETAYYGLRNGAPERRDLGSQRLDQARFQEGPGAPPWEELSFTGASDDEGRAPEASTALWPEDFGDPDIYRVYGDETEGARRVNIVIVPDGYTYAEKALMEQHATAMVTHFRGKTPYAEHDSFINYTLVYAYSQQSGTDQCDCSIVLDTAMGTRFLNAGDPCGGSANRCLYYGGGCDTHGNANIIAAELRAPVIDTTVIMVNTPRYGGCGGARAVYSAGNSSATEVAVHELGHSLAGLADEYDGNAACGAFAGEINTSLNPFDGAWKEWIDILGPPRQGGQYYNQCVYRPLANCEMRSLFQPFCPVCNQRWALKFFGHPRVAPTAPISGMTPAPAAEAMAGVATGFAVETRLAAGPAVTNSIGWTVQGPGDAEPVPIGDGNAALAWTFPEPGSYELRCEVIADTNFIRPLRYGANVGEAIWSVEVAALAAPGEVSPPGSPLPLLFHSPSALSWEDASAAGAAAYHVYRATLTDARNGSYGDCYAADVMGPGIAVPESPAVGQGWAWLVTAVNPVAEGPAGTASSGVPRVPTTPCD